MNKKNSYFKGTGVAFAKGFTIEHLWMAIPFFVVFLKGMRIPLLPLDFWWHLKMGEVILTTHAIPHVDLFSFTASGKTFLAQNWLAEVIYFGMFKLGGLPGIICLNSFLLVLALVPVLLLCREATGRVRISSVAALLGGIALFPNARPQVFSFCLFALFYWILDGYRFRQRNVIWLMPLLMVLWVNLHGAFVVGLGLIALFLVSESMRAFGNPDSKYVLSKLELMSLVLVLAACVFATLLNPYTYRIYDYIRVVLSDKASQKLVMEWQPPRIDLNFMSRYFYGLFYFAILGLIFSRQKPGLTDICLFLGFSLFAFEALRNTVWFGIVAAPLLARYWGEVDVAPLQKWLHQFRFSFLRTKSHISRNTKSNLQPHYRLNLILIIVAGFLLISYSPWVAPALRGTSLIDPKIPVKAFDYIEQHGLTGRIFHPQIYGDYLIWRLYPKQRSFVDGRVHLFGEKFIDEFLETFYESNWEERLTSYDIQYLLLSKDELEEGSKSLIKKARATRNWCILYEDDKAVLFGKNRIKNPDGKS